MESRDRAAGDRDEAEREYLAREHRSRAVDEPRQCRHLQRRQRDERRRTGDWSDLLPSHLPERFTISSNRRRQNHEILNGASERHTDDDPDDAWQVAELRRERRTDQRSRSGDRGEVMPEYDPS